MTLPLVVEMTVDTGNSYELSAETNQHEINLDNELEINVVSYDVPEYQGSYTVDAGLSPVVLNTQDKRLTQNVTVNALQEMTLNAPTISVNSSNGQITATVNYTPGYNDVYAVVPTMTPLSTQAGTTITPTTSEQTAVASGKYTLGAVKVGAIPSQYADITGVTANASDVLAGKYFVNNLGELTLGTAIAGGGDGAPMPVDTVAEMIDTTKVYLYVGSETGYTFGNWYYYDGNDWVSGGKWGADGGVNTNARNLLDYILERVAYTETGMQVYVDALYEALAQAGTVTTTYTITNALSHVTNSNTATGCDEGDSYTGTLTADTDYTIDTVTVTMGGTDITSTAYNNGVITIASVTGDIVITASAIVVPVTIPVTYTQGSLGAPNSDANRVSGVITAALHFDTETYTITAASGYSIYPFGYSANSDSTKAGTRLSANVLYTYAVSDSGYIATSNANISGTLYANTRTLDNTGNFGWQTGTVTYSFTKTGVYGYSFTGLGFLVKKDDGSNITPQQIAQVITVSEVGE